MKRARGYTLIEILVVLVVIGIIVSFARLGGAFNSPERSLEALAQREAGRIRARCDEAELSAQDLGFLVTKESISVMQWVDDAWRQQPDSLQPFGDQVRLSVEKNGVLLPAEQIDGPALVCTASGEFTPFALEFSHPAAARRARISGTADGVLTLSMKE